MQQTRGSSGAGIHHLVRTLFESLIKVDKKTLKARVGNAGLNDDEFQTEIKEVEAPMSSRPLSYEGTDPRDKAVLTPSHFLVDRLGG